ncbi:hypothetical protein BGX38DRAFT_1270088 [Terfezia claveryi]|nr:hypothetical protein BGX38DRAFT_1270088 [Terfezia claveryi]
MISNDGECRILSIIDWDGATTSPLCIGNERYPSWLSREWHPVVYHYDPHDPENNDLENSPEELERFRDIYSTYMQDLVGCEREALTEFSHIYEMLEIAAANVYSIKSIVHSLCRKCITASRPRDLDDDEDIYLYDVIQAFEGDFPEQMVIDRLRDGFLQLCGQEF